MGSGPVTRAVILAAALTASAGCNSGAEQVASVPSGPARRVVSVNLCTDELLLLLARPDQVAGVSFLAQDALESPLWRSAQRYPGNNGTIEEVLALHPDVILTMGGGGRSRGLLARRLGIHPVDLAIPNSLDQVEGNLRIVATALGDFRRADPWIARIESLRRTAPAEAIDSIWVSAGGFSLSPDSLGARWLRLAGLRQRPLSGDRATLETLLTTPPKVLVSSDYRSGEMSGGNRWLTNPVVREAGARQLATDGRPWTCLGPLMIPEIERLRMAIQ